MAEDARGRTVPEADGGPSWRRFAVIAAQLVALLLVMQRFHIESEAFFRLAVLTVAGFAVHYWLPLRRRLPFFVVLSFAGIVLVLGVEQAGWLVALGLVMLGITHLPLSIRWRVILLGLIGLALAVARWAFPRYQLGQVPWSAAIWPIFGSMFVFRLIIYLYDLKHGAGPSRLSQTLAYFFLLPNVCFPLFPVVDFKKFCRNYYDQERHQIYQVGVEWIWRGVIQLLLYRLIYYHLTLDPVAVENAADLALYMLSTYGLYIRISGQFHLVIGILHLFGFNLPETHHRYFLASSFTDFWRRINIYWKDFMLKVVYYPAYFQLRKVGDTPALVIATAFTFLVTWFLHLVQWFWIRGGVLVEWNDIIFWSILGLLVIVNSLYEARHGRVRTLSKVSRSLSQSAGLALRTAGTFITLCVLWSFWSSESVSDWWLMCRTALRLPPASEPDFLALLAIVGSSVLAIGTGVYASWKGWGTGRPGNVPHHAAATVLVTSIVLCALTAPPVTAQLAAAGDLVTSLRATSLNKRDAEEFQRGYYETLVEVRKFNDELGRVYAQIPDDFVTSLDRAGLSRPTGDEQQYELAPLREGSFASAAVRTNRWGMRDHDYSQVPQEGVYRIAVLGPSTAMGSGVDEDETFVSVVEERLNRERGGAHGHYEILNFGVPGYSPLHELYQLQRTVLPLRPDMLWHIAHSSDGERSARQLTGLLQVGIVPREPYLRDLIHRSGLKVGMGPTEQRRRIKRFSDELLLWVFSRMAALCRERQVHPVLIFMEGVGEIVTPAKRESTLAAARAAGFSIIDLTGAYGSLAPAELWVRESDGHPNALGNRLLANRLYAEFLRLELTAANARAAGRS